MLVGSEIWIEDFRIPRRDRGKIEKGEEKGWGREGIGRRGRRIRNRKSSPVRGGEGGSGTGWKEGGKNREDERRLWEWMIICQWMLGKWNTIFWHLLGLMPVEGLSVLAQPIQYAPRVHSNKLCVGQVYIPSLWPQLSLSTVKLEKNHVQAWIYNPQYPKRPLSTSLRWVRMSSDQQ